MFDLNAVDPLPRMSASTLPAPNANWNSAPADFKDNLRVLMFANQFGTCCYCNVEITSDASRLADVEHFVHKKKRSKWSCYPDNLLLACKFCNQNRKATYEVVRADGKDYVSYVFWIVHPYIDSVHQHISGGFSDISTKPTVPKPLTLKGARSIWLFNLHLEHKFDEWSRIYNSYLAHRSFTHSQSVLFDKAVAELRAAKHPSRFNS